MRSVSDSKKLANVSATIKKGGLNALFETVGGIETCRRLSESFHERVEKDQVLRKQFPKNMTALTEHLALFFAERLGGPPAYTARRGKQSLVCRHAALSISTTEADLWLGHMFDAIDEVGIVDPGRQQLRDYLVETAQTLTDPFIPFYHLPIRELSERVSQDPGLLAESPAGHSLLRHAIWRWDVPRVQTLVEHGADVNAKEPFAHSPLYWAANSHVTGKEADGRTIVDLLLAAGADVNWPSGPGRAVPLHMAARRGHVSIAEALLDAGADIEQRDSKGETPLRRAVNCRHPQLVRLLLSRGANRLSRDKKGLTPIDAARNTPIEQVLHSR